VLNAKWGTYAPLPGEQDVLVSRWTITAGLPDGRVVILKERQKGTGEPRLIGRIGPNVAASTLNLVDGGVVDRDAILPVRFHVPDGGGWIVAHKGVRLSYRTSPDEPWQDAGRDAALLPDDTTDVLAGDHFVRLR
jgi:hypothetical protein